MSAEETKKARIVLGPNASALVAEARKDTAETRSHAQILDDWIAERLAALSETKTTDAPEKVADASAVTLLAQHVETLTDAMVSGLDLLHRELHFQRVLIASLTRKDEEDFRAFMKEASARLEKTHGTYRDELPDYNELQERFVAMTQRHAQERQDETPERQPKRAGRER